MPTAPKRFGIPALAKADKPWSHKGKTTTERGYGWQHQKARKALLQQDPLCRECRKHDRVTEAVIADHIKPLAEGGSRDASNLAPMCAACHREKTLREAQRGKETAI